MSHDPPPDLDNCHLQGAPIPASLFWLIPRNQNLQNNSDPVSLFYGWSTLMSGQEREVIILFAASSVSDYG